jgi:hypothetical protein
MKGFNASSLVAFSFLKSEKATKSVLKDNKQRLKFILDNTAKESIKSVERLVRKHFSFNNTFLYR